MFSRSSNTEKLMIILCRKYLCHCHLPCSRKISWSLGPKSWHTRDCAFAIIPAATTAFASIAAFVRTMQLSKPSAPKPSASSASSSLAPAVPRFAEAALQGTRRQRKTLHAKCAVGRGCQSMLGLGTKIHWHRLCYGTEWASTTPWTLLRLAAAGKAGCSASHLHATTAKAATATAIAAVVPAVSLPPCESASLSLSKEVPSLKASRPHIKYCFSSLLPSIQHHARLAPAFLAISVAPAAAAATAAFSSIFSWQR